MLMPILFQTSAAMHASPAIEIKLPRAINVAVGLPLRLPYEFVDGRSCPIWTDQGTDLSAWAHVQVVDASGTIRASSRPEIALPDPTGPNGLSLTYNGLQPYLGLCVEGRSAREATLVPRLDTSRLAPGDYELSIQVDLPVSEDDLVLRHVHSSRAERNDLVLTPEVQARMAARRSSQPDVLRRRFHVHLRVVSDPKAVASRARALIAQTLRSRPVPQSFPSPGMDGDGIRELSLIDRDITLPLLEGVEPLRWSDAQVGVVTRAFAPEATAREASMIAHLLCRRIVPDAAPGLELLRRSKDTEVSAIGERLSDDLDPAKRKQTP